MTKKPKLITRVVCPDWNLDFKLADFPGPQQAFQEAATRMIKSLREVDKSVKFEVEYEHG